MEPRDMKLVDRARSLIRARFREGRHHIASVLRTRSGRIFDGVHVEVYVGRITVCGEAVAIGAAATAGDTEIETIVAVDETGRIVSPCGMCREMIADYAPEATVILQVADELKTVPVRNLLPYPYEQS